jgi:putative transcriptional regulator
MKTPRRRPSRNGAPFLVGQMLIAMPSMPDKRFQRAVIYMCTHSTRGAMGFIINQVAPNVSFTDLLQQVSNTSKRKPGAGTVPARSPPLPKAMAHGRDIRIHTGGPVETGRGFVLHSPDYFARDSTVELSCDICLTNTLDILHAMASGEGPHRAILALGYAQWAAGQLEDELLRNTWLHCQADPDLVFAKDLDSIYSRAMGILGINPAFLVEQAGRA